MAYALESFAATLALERVIYERRALVQPLPSALQLAIRQKGAHFLSDLVVAHAGYRGRRENGRSIGEMCPSLKSLGYQCDMP